MNSELRQMHEELGIHHGHLSANRLTLQEQPPLTKLRVVDIDFEGKPFILLESTARAWTEMRGAALKDRVAILPFSGFRSYLHQKNMIERRLKSGRVLEEILTNVAIPGFSEHHTGRAIDIHAEGSPTVEETFESTEAFAWLMENAGRFGFRLSYPRSNPLGIIYEPWHWFYTGS